MEKERKEVSVSMPATVPNQTLGIFYLMHRLKKNVLKIFFLKIDHRKSLLVACL